ncbi:MAG: rRNA pseudouridine synthase [Bacteroidetes bacterium]|nr:rRNA pseudouridine synthase [Bacteroidota bacterium]
MELIIIKLFFLTLQYKLLNMMKEGSSKDKRKKHGDFSTFINKKAKSKFAHKKKPPVSKEQSKEVKKRQKKYSKTTYTKGGNGGLIRLNKYIADAGICSRREADKLIDAGVIKVNGKIITLLGTKVSPSDKVQYGDQTITREKTRYVLLNKPRGFITTTEDPFERKTVMNLVRNACNERIYPVGRLDRNTTGLLLFTNNGELAKKLTHPKHGVRKIYHVVLDKALSKKDIATIAEGIELEDGFIKVDAIAYAEGGKNKREVGIELHSGKNRIIKRLFESVGYNVLKLDRVVFAGLTKKDVPRGKWRHLKEKEVGFLKMIK